MKKFLFLIFVMVIIPAQIIAQDEKDDSSSKRIELEFRQENNPPSFHRAPLHIDIEVYYNQENSTINIIYEGEASGEVILYLNEKVIGYDSIINTSFPILAIHGLYKIEIYGETWIAQGKIEI